ADEEADTPADTPAAEPAETDAPAADGNDPSALRSNGKRRLIVPVAFQSDEAAPATPADNDKAPAAAAEVPTTEGTQPPADASTAEEPAKTDEELQEELEFVREQIAKENQRKIDARNEKMDAARRRVQELNARFADWYYVVSDEVYKKLKISREQLIGPNTPDAAQATPAAPGQSTPGLPPGFNLQP
ncbi:MAG: hypothetical protein KDA72_19570, partial [Planctomycetales bacterium]|nr:hypothetical protein [Planctomycetales bacterium]